MRTKEEIDAAFYKFDEHGSSKYPGQTYEQGLAAALQWVVGEIDDLDEIV